MSVYTSLFISLFFNACVSLYSLVLLILLNRVAWLVLLFELSLCNSDDLGLSVRVQHAVDNEDDDPDDYNEFRSGYGLNNDAVFDNDNTDPGEEYACMTVTDSWLLFERMNTKMMISYCTLVYSMLVVI